MRSLLLDRARWDLTKDAGGNIAVCTEPYRIAQDVACAIKTFKGEVWYDTTLGIPYFERILGQNPSVPYLKAQFVGAAQSVDGVAAAVCFLDGVAGRLVTGQVQITDTNGAQGVVTMGTGPGSAITIPS